MEGMRRYEKNVLVDSHASRCIPFKSAGACTKMQTSYKINMSRLNATSSKIVLSSYFMKEIYAEHCGTSELLQLILQCDCKTCETCETLHVARHVLCVLCEPGNYLPGSLEERWSSSNHDRGHVPRGTAWHSRKTQSSHDTKWIIVIHMLHINIHPDTYQYTSWYILIHPAHESLPFIWLTLGVKVTPARHCKGVLWSYDVLWKVCRNPWATLCLIALGSSVQGHNNSFQIVEGHINGLKHSHNISKIIKIW
jgi:hypothetical protein